MPFAAWILLLSCVKRRFRSSFLNLVAFPPSSRRSCCTLSVQRSEGRVAGEGPCGEKEQRAEEAVEPPLHARFPGRGNRAVWKGGESSKLALGRRAPAVPGGKYSLSKPFRGSQATLSNSHGCSMGLNGWRSNRTRLAKPARSPLPGGQKKKSLPLDSL